MRDRDPAMGAGGLAAAPREVPDPLGWDETGAIVILLFAAADLDRWLAAVSIGPVALRVLWGLIYLAGARRLVQRFGAAWLVWMIRHQRALCILLAISVASCVWSLAPFLTLQKATSLLFTTMLGVFIGYTIPPPGFVRVLRWTFAVLIVAGIAVALVSPPPLHGWSGVMDYKNSFGAAAVLATTLFLADTVTGRIHLLWGATLSMLSAFAVVQSRSRTSLVALGVCVVASASLAVASATRRPTQEMLRRMALGLVLVVSVLPFLLAPLATVLGDRDPLNGRIDRWAAGLTILRERPATGYGYATVWGRSDATFLPHIAVTAHPSSTNAHNSIVDVATELGIPAAIIACFYLFGALSDAGRLFERAPSTFSLLALVFLIGMTVMGFAETLLLRIHSIFWILFVALTVAVKRTRTRGVDDDSPAPT